MIVEVVGCSTQNKGAELLLLAVADHYAGRLDVQLAVTPWFGSWQDRAKYGLLSRIDVKKLGRSYLALNLLPSSARKSYGIVSYKDVNVVLDASGFAYGDQHGPAPARAFADYYGKMRRLGKKIVLLPQAFGPFRNPEVVLQARRLLHCVDMIYVRDKASLQYLQEITPDTARIREAPDITVGLHVRRDTSRDPQGTNAVAIVPNNRMLDKSSPTVAAAYIPAIGAIVRHIRDLGMSPCILVHDESEDLGLARKIIAEEKLEVPLIHERDPLRLKAIIGSFQMVIGSRFHSLVSALSQSVPAVAIGWSHKYQMLLESYGCAENIIQLNERGADFGVLDRLADAAARNALRAALDDANSRLTIEKDQMWTEVDRVAGI